jgi:hypothetical protein
LPRSARRSFLAIAMATTAIHPAPPISQCRSCPGFRRSRLVGGTLRDDGTNDTYTDEDGNTRTDHDVIARSRLRVDTRKWLLSKALPKIYGDKVEATHTLSADAAFLDLWRLVSSGKGFLPPPAAPIPLIGTADDAETIEEEAA